MSTQNHLIKAPFDPSTYADRVEELLNKMVVAEKVGQINLECVDDFEGLTEGIELAREVARKSAVLLENKNGTLPLDKAKTGCKGNGQSAVYKSSNPPSNRHLTEEKNTPKSLTQRALYGILNTIVFYILCD